MANQLKFVRNVQKALDAEAARLGVKLEYRAFKRHYGCSITLGKAVRQMQINCHMQAFNEVAIRNEVLRQFRRIVEGMKPA